MVEADTSHVRRGLHGFLLSEVNNAIFKHLYQGQLWGSVTYVITLGLTGTSNG